MAVNFNTDSLTGKCYRSSLSRGLLFLALLVAIALIFYLYNQGVWNHINEQYKYFISHKKLGDLIYSYGPYASLIFVAAQALQVLFAPIPGDVTGFVGGFLFGNGMGMLLSTVGLTLGSLSAFYISRTFGLRVVERIVKKEYVDKFNFFITHRGIVVSFVLFLIPGFPKDSLCYLLGLTRMRLADFLILNIFGRLPGTLILTLQGSAVSGGKYHAFFILLAGSVLLTSVLYLARNRIIKIRGPVEALVSGENRNPERA